MGVDQLTVLIVDGDDSKHLERCIEYASRIGREVVYLNTRLDEQGISRAKRLGVCVAPLDAFKSSDLHTDWVLFIRPWERPVLSSAKEFSKKLMTKKAPEGYGVYVTKANTKHLLEQFQWVRKLDQFKDTGDSACVHTIEPRLVKRKLAEKCLRELSNASLGELSWVCGKIAPGIAIESMPHEVPADRECPRDHDIRCLKGEIIYDFTPEEDMVELSEAYTGFRIIHKGQLDGFIEGARQGFGHFKMYIPMLDFLCKEGYFDEAGDLFETWVRNRPDDKEQCNVQLMGGMIYANLLQPDKAIRWFERIKEGRNSDLAFSNLGKLYLVKGEKEKAVEYLKKSKDISGDVFLKKRILSVIDKKEWRPLKLSLCMIARDEKTHIEKALKSVDGVVDEIIVVDTGSADRTKEIAKKLGGKVVEMAWQDDFSKARNAVIEEASCDYILVMDADEFIDPRHRFSLALFKKLLPVAQDIAFGIKVEPAKASKSLSMSYLDKLLKTDEGVYRTRILPKKPGIRFHGGVFESPDKTIKTAGVKLVRTNLFCISHSMHEREQREKRKIPAALKAFKSVNDSSMALEGALLFLRNKDLDGAYPWLLKAGKINPGLCAKIAKLYLKQDKLEIAEEILAKALEYFPDSGEFLLSLAELYYKREDFDGVINILWEKTDNINSSLPPEQGAIVDCYLGISMMESGKIVEGIEQLACAQEKDPDNTLCGIAAVYAFTRAGHWEEALRIVSQIAVKEGVDITQEVKDFVDVGRVFMEMNRHFTHTGKTEEGNLCRKVIEGLIKTGISGEGNMRRMPEVMENAGGI